MCQYHTWIKQMYLQLLLSHLYGLSKSFQSLRTSLSHFYLSYTFTASTISVWDVRQKSTVEPGHENLLVPHRESQNEENVRKEYSGSNEMDGTVEPWNACCSWNLWVPTGTKDWPAYESTFAGLRQEVSYNAAWHFVLRAKTKKLSLYPCVVEPTSSPKSAPDSEVEHHDQE